VQEAAKYPLINFVCHIFRVLLCAYFVPSMVVLCKAMLDDFFVLQKKKYIFFVVHVLLSHS
jgi:hypothetical protein